MKHPGLWLAVLFLLLVGWAQVKESWQGAGVGGVVAMGVDIPGTPAHTPIPTDLPDEMKGTPRRLFTVIDGMVVTSTPVPLAVVASMNHRMMVQVNDTLGVGAVCADGTPAEIVNTYPDAVVFSCIGE